MGAQVATLDDDADPESRYELVGDSDSDSEHGIEEIDGDVIVQFTSALYYVEEEEHEILIDIMRLGSQDCRVSCCFSTEDMSGHAGERYESTTGQVVFEPGEMQKSFAVPIIAPTNWSVTLEFKVRLHTPRGCHLGNYLHTCRVKVISAWKFPSNKYAIYHNDLDDLRTVGALGLFWEYCKMNFWMPGMGWRTVLCLLGDQLQNIYIFYKLWALTYMLNEIFSGAHDRSPDQVDVLTKQAFLIGLGYIFPMLVLHAWELAKIQIDIGGHSKNFLQNSIITKYLNYSDESRREVDVADVQIAVRENSSEMADSYLAVLAILRLVGKLIVILYFTSQQNPRALHYVMIMPLFMLVFVCLRHEVLSNAWETPNNLGSRVLAFVDDLSQNYRLIANYHQRPHINEIFSHRSGLWRAAVLSPLTVAFNNHFFSHWLGQIFVGVYVMLHARAVITGDLGTGTFIGILSVFSELSADFSAGYDDFLKITSKGSTFRFITFMLNCSTDLIDLKKLNRKRRVGTQVARERILKDKSIHHPFPTDLIALELNSVSYSIRGQQILHNITLSARQGGVVAIMGQHGQARQTFLKLIAHEFFPSGGEIFIPTHLRILLVSQEVYIMRTSVLHNLTFGHPDADIERVKEILTKLQAWTLLKEVHSSLSSVQALNACDSCSSLGSDDSSNYDDSRLPWCLGEEVPDEHIDIRGVEPKDCKWIESVRYSEKAKLHLARALIMNPEVMVLQRPLLHFNDSEKNCILDVIYENSCERGVGFPPDSAHSRRPRTTFMSVENEEQAKRADVVWSMQDPGAASSVIVVRDASPMPGGQWML